MKTKKTDEVWLKENSWKNMALGVNLMYEKDVEKYLKQKNKQFQKKIEILKEIEDKLDKINGEYGNKKRLCIFCRSNKFIFYHSGVRIVHNKECIMLKLRKILKGD